MQHEEFTLHNRLESATIIDGYAFLGNLLQCLITFIVKIESFYSIKFSVLQLVPTASRPVTVHLVRRVAQSPVFPMIR